MKTKGCCPLSRSSRGHAQCVTLIQKKKKKEKKERADWFTDRETEEKREGNLREHRALDRRQRQPVSPIDYWAETCW
jgi:hypothetical protein